MGMMILPAPTQPTANATAYDVYADGKKMAVRLIAADGFELVKDGEEPNGIRAVDIPAAYEERINDYTAIPKIEEEEKVNGNN